MVSYECHPGLHSREVMNSEDKDYQAPCTHSHCTCPYHCLVHEILMFMAIEIEFNHSPDILGHPRQLKITLKDEAVQVLVTLSSASDATAMVTADYSINKYCTDFFFFFNKKIN